MDRGRFLATTLHYALRLAEQHTALLTAAVRAQQGNASSSGSGGASSSSSGSGGASSGSSSSSGRRSSARQQQAGAAAADAAAAAAKVAAHTAAVLSGLGIIREVSGTCMRSAGQGTDAALAWARHNSTVVTLLQRLTRSDLPHSSSSSSRGGGSSRVASSPLPTLEDSGPWLKQLQDNTDDMLLALIYGAEGQAILLGDQEWYSYETGVDMQQQLHSLVVSYLKRCSQCPATANAAMLEGLAMLCVAFGTGLALKLAQQYSLAAVRAAVAPWMVLLGRLMRVLAACMQQKVQQVLTMRGAGGMGLVAAQDDLVTLIKAARRICLLGDPDVQLMQCWLGTCAGQFAGQEQHPGPPLEAGSSSSSPAAPLWYPKHHLQHPNIPVQATLAAAGAAAAGGVTGQAGEVAASTEGSSSSAPLVCVLLDDLDSWYVQQLLKTREAAMSVLAAAHSTRLPAEGGSSSSMQPADECFHQVLQALRQAQLPEQLSATGLALCNSLPVPWLCNNPDCLALGCASESVLVGGKGCVCAGCRVARWV